MTSPYSSSLLQEPAPAAAAAGPSPYAPVHHRHVTHVVAQPQPVYMPVAQPQPVAPAHTRGGGLSSVALALVVVLVGVVALVAGYYATTQASPTAREAAVVQNTVARDAFRNGRTRGISAGRSDALSLSSTTTAMRASIARQAAYDKAYARGMKAGRRSYRAPRYTGGYRGYRAPRFGGYGGYAVAGALGQAQNIANLTGAPVDVEIY